MDILNSLAVMKTYKLKIIEIKAERLQYLESIAPIEFDNTVQDYNNSIESYENLLKFEEWMITTTYSTNRLEGYSVDEINRKIKKLRLHQTYI